MIPADDRGLTLGDGLFETVLAVDGALLRWPEHLARMGQGCAVLGLPPPDPGHAERLARQALRAAGLDGGRAAVRLTLTAGSGGRGLNRPETLVPRLLATVAPAPAPTAPARLVTASVRRNAGSPLSRIKSLAYLDNVLARREALASGGDEAVMLNTEGLVACAAAANLFWVGQGALFTPALDCGVLAGVTRTAVITAAQRLGVACRELRAGEAEPARAEALFLTSSLIGVRPVSAWDGRAFAPSALVDRLARALG